MVSAALLSSQALCMSKVARVRMTPCFRQMFVWGGFRPFPVFRPFFFFPSLSNSSDKLSLSSAHMALGKNQCPHVSSAALHCADEG